MKFIHLADLHFGKTIYGTSLVDSGDRGYWAEKFIELADEIRPDAVLISGDVYDRSAPSGEAVKLMSSFLTALTDRGIQVMLIAGNHDSAPRLSFARELLSRQKQHISGDLANSCELVKVRLEDEYGPVNFWLMPYVFPALLARALGDENIRDYESGIRELLSRQDIDFSERNVLLAHQNVTAFGEESRRGGSETMVGGVGQVDFSAFDGFDYVALGHIHSAYSVGRKEVRYAGSPLCYHFDETKQDKKGPLLVELREKGEEPKIELKAIPALHPMRELRGKYSDIELELSSGIKSGEYLRIVLTNQRITPEASDHLHSLCNAKGSTLMELVSDYSELERMSAGLTSEAVREKSIEELFADFFRGRSGEEPDGAFKNLIHMAAEKNREFAEISDEPSAAEVAGLADSLERVKA